MAIQVGVGTAAVDITTRYRAVALVTVVHMDWRSIAARRLTASRVIGCVTFITAPAIIFTTGAGGWRKVDLFKTILADITDPQVTVRRSKLKRQGLRSPVAQRSHRRRRRRHWPADCQGGNPIICAAARVAVRPVAGRTVDINAQNFTQQNPIVLAIIVRITAAPHPLPPQCKDSRRRQIGADHRCDC